MARGAKKRSTKAGLPPGSLVHIGEKKVAQPEVVLLAYDEQQIAEKTAATVEDCASYRQRPGVTWLDVAGLHRVELMETIGNCFGLHPLTQEDILNTDQRPKMETFDDYVYVVLQMLDSGDDNRIAAEQFSLVLGSDFVLSFREGEGDVFDPVRERIRRGAAHIRTMGADYLAYSLLDAVVDRYFAVLERLGDQVELLEDRLITRPTPDTLRRIYRMRHEMVLLRRAVWPLREGISGLQRGESPLIGPATRVYLADVYDHVAHVIDTVETYRDLLAGMLDIYLSSQNNRLNEIMKVLTMIATIFMPLTFIAGVYGMNFKIMPELDWPLGYPAVLLVMLATVAAMLAYFRRKGWL